MTSKLPMLVMLLSVAASCAHSGPGAGPTEPDLVRFAILSTTDIHGRLLPEPMAVRHADGTTHTVEMGGVDVLAAYLDALRRKYDGRVVLVDCGDIFQGTMLSNEFEGATLIRALGKLGYQAAAVGNHEFDFGQVGPLEKATADGDPFGALKARFASSAFPALTANILERATDKPLAWPGFQPYRVVQVGPVRVGLVGVTSPGTPNITIAEVKERLKFLPLASTLTQYAAQLRTQESADVLVGVMHAGGACERNDSPDDISSCDPKEELFQVARELPQGTYDILLGGHSHRIVAHRVGTTTLLQAGANLHYVAVAEVTWSNSQKRVVSIQPYLVPLCPWVWANGDSCLVPGSGPRVAPAALGQPVESQAFLTEILQPEERALMERSQAETGSVVAAEMEHDGVNSPEGLLVTAILLELRPEASIAIFNRSGVRTYLHKGPILVEDVYQMLPFDNTLATVRLTGSQLLELLTIATSGAHDLPIVRGVRLKVDLNQDPCVLKDKNGDGQHERWERERLVTATLEDGTPIVADKEYTIVTNSYLSDGGSDFSHVFSTLPKGNIVKDKDFLLLREAVERWLRARKVELGTGSETFTRHPGAPLVEVIESEVKSEGCIR